MFLFVLGDIRRVSLIFLLCGIAVYMIDYRGLRNKKQYERETTFSKVTSLTYVGGCIVMFVGSWVLGLFL